MLSKKIRAGSMAGLEHFQPVQKLPLEFFVLSIPKISIPIGNAYRLFRRHKIRIAIEEFGEARINGVYRGPDAHHRRDVRRTTQAVQTAATIPRRPRRPLSISECSNDLF
jgi:hypothetical protein